MSYKASAILTELIGVRPIMFDRYCGELTKKVTIPPEERAYINEDGTLYFPVENLMSFLSAQNTESAPQRVIGKHWKAVARAALSYISIESEGGGDRIPIVHCDGRPATREDLVIKHHVARVKKGQLAIPNPKHRPVLANGWRMKFGMVLEDNKDLDHGTLKDLFEIGGRSIGLGTYRGPFGKFRVASWEVKAIDS